MCFGHTATPTDVHIYIRLGNEAMVIGQSRNVLIRRVGSGLFLTLPNLNFAAQFEIFRTTTVTYRLGQFVPCSCSVHLSGGLK
jgi:hypothetical protein